MVCSQWSRVAVCVLALALGCRKFSGPPDPGFEKASQLYQQLYTHELDEAYGDPQMEQVVDLLQKVEPNSVDKPSAQALLGAIERGKAELAKTHVEREKMRKAAEQVISAPSTIDPSAVLARPDAGTGAVQDPYGPGASIAEINLSSGGCLVAGEPFRETGTNRAGTVYRLSQSPVCAQKLPGFVGQLVMVAEGRIYRRVLETQVPQPARDGGVPSAGAADAGPARATQARAAPPDAGESTATAAAQDAGTSY